MSRDRAIELHEGVLFDPHNVAETASHCRARNRILQANTPNAAAAAQTLIARALQYIRKRDYTPGELFPVFNAWCVVDEPDPRVSGTLGTDELPSAPQANFFVRLGRQPVLREVNESDGG